MTRNRARGSKGQLLVGAIVFLLVLSVIVESMVWYSKLEIRETTHVQHSDSAYRLAESGIERAFLDLEQSNNDYENIVAGNPLTGYKFDQAYTDVKNGKYAVQVTSGPSLHEIQIASIGRDDRTGETRGVLATYDTGLGGQFAMRANGISITGNNIQVEWGPVMSQNPINSSGRLSPFYWSASAIDLDGNGPTPPNNDQYSCQWKSWDPNLPPSPAVNLGFYKSSATATGTYFNTNQTFSGLLDTSGHTYYIDGDLTLQPPNVYIVGNVIVTGNLFIPNGNWGNGTEAIPVPQNAWQQYCANWTYYKTTYDPSAPVMWPGSTSTYVSNPSLTFTDHKVGLHGFLYVGGNLSMGGGGGSSSIVGSVLVNGAAMIPSNSNVRIFYSPDVSSKIVYAHTTLSRTSWMETASKWPNGL
jgi:hypothetical protein